MCTHPRRQTKAWARSCFHLKESKHENDASSAVLQGQLEIGMTHPLRFQYQQYGAAFRNFHQNWLLKGIFSIKLLPEVCFILCDLSIQVVQECHIVTM